MTNQSRSDNHEKAPICAEFVKEMRNIFGEDQVKVLYVREGKIELGELNELDQPA